MIVASRQHINTSFQHKFQYRFRDLRDNNLPEFEVDANEDTEQVDGIGGVNWDGAIVMSHFIQILLHQLEYRTTPVVVEVGCGTALSGIAAFLSGANVVSTDRYSDLASQNINTFLSKYPATSSDNNRWIFSSDLSWGDADAANELKENISQKFPFIRNPHYIVGAEIACLIKQQDLLVETIRVLSNSALDVLHRTRALISFDNLPSDRNYKYFSSFLEKMKIIDYYQVCVGAARVTWQSESESTKVACFENVSSEFLDCEENNEVVQLDLTFLCRETNNANIEIFGTTEDCTCHQLLLFFHASEIKTCSVCDLKVIPGFSCRNKHSN